MTTSSPKATPTFRQSATDIDHHVGAMIRQRRILLGLTQTQLAELIGATYQQVHKYEKGINRVSASRLYQIAEVLGVEAGHFFPERSQAPSVVLPPHQRMSLELTRNFAAITDARQRQLVCDVARSFVGNAAEDVDTIAA